MTDKAIRAANLTLGGMLEKRRSKSAVERAQGQIAPSKYLPGVPRQVHADGGRENGDGIQAAEAVAKMLRDGRASEITNDHLDAADPQHLSKLYETGQTGMDLPMDHASRMERAKAMGFGNDPKYHGTGADFQNFHNSRRGNYFSDKPEIADIYAEAAGKRNQSTRGQLANADANVIPALLREPTLEVSDQGVGGGGYSTDNLAKHFPEVERSPLGSYARRLDDAAKQKGYSTVKIANMDDLGGMQDQWRPVDPANIRSRFARFDPRLAHLSHLSAATGGRIARADGGRENGMMGDNGGRADFLAGNHPLVPEVLYHGTARDIQSFDPDAKRSYDVDPSNPEETDTGWFGKGHYFTASPKLAAHYASEGAKRQGGQGANVLPAHVAMKNPFVVDMKAYDSGAKSLDNALSRAGVPMHPRGWRKPSEQTAALVGMGHDGVIATREGKPEEYVAFHPTQIKSAISARQFDTTDPNITKADGGRIGYADGGRENGMMGDNGGPPLSEPPIDLGAAREQKQVQGFHKGLMGDIAGAAAERMDAHQKAIDAGVFDGYEVGDTLQGSAHPMRITGRFVRPWKPSTTVLSHFDRMGAKPTIIEHNGKQYIPMLRYQTGREGVDGFQEGDAYLDGVKAAGYRKMGGLRAVKADGGSVADRSPMFEGMSEHLRDDQGQPLDLYHGTPGQPFEAFDDAKLGARDAGFYGRGHYLTPDKDLARAYADNYPAAEAGATMGPMHAALKNPFVWDMSDEGSAYRTKKDLETMGIKREGRMDPWDNLRSHEISQFMQHMKQRGHDGVIVKQPDWQDGENGRVSEIVVFNPNMIKHRDAEVGDPNDPRIMRADGGKVSGLYSKAAQIVRGMKDQKMDVADILKYAEGKGAKRSELSAVGVPPGKATPAQVADHMEFMQPSVGVHRREGGNFRFNNSQSYLNEMDRLHDAGRHGEAERLYDEFEQFSGYGGDDQPRYAQYQLPGGENYREHVLTLDSHEGDPYYARNHWGKLENPLAHIRMSDRMMGNKKILHIEEMQSDWNNDARRQGFRTGREKQEYQDYVAGLRQKMIDNYNAMDASPMIKQALAEKAQKLDPYMLAMKMGVQSEHNEMARKANENMMAPPQAPYINPKKDEWSELAMKHALTEAAKGGYDGITFTPDEAQSERWGGTNFNSMYNKKLPGMAQKLIQQHDPETEDDMMHLSGWATPMIPLSEEARGSILKNGFPSFRRGGYVTHVRRAR